MGKIKQSFCYGCYVSDDAPVETLIKEAAGAGYAAVELWARAQAPFEEILELADKYGIAVASMSGHNSLRDGLNKPENHDRIEQAVREILVAVGEDPDREGLQETPARVARMYAEMFQGLRSDPRIHLKKFFTEEYDEVVLVRDISFCSMCEHHLLPFMGKAHIGYLPNGKVLGLSKLARVVDDISRRPQVQERMTEEIANLRATGAI